MGYYNIDSGDGNELAAGMNEITARRAAQRIANERGESVYLYEVGAGDGESPAESEEITPNARTADAWWRWHDADSSRWSTDDETAERRCAAWVAGESDDGPEVSP